MKNEIIKKNLIITILSLLIFFVLSIFATSYSIRNSFENEVVSVSQMIENQIEDGKRNDKDVINSFTYNQSWLKLVYATSSGLIIIDSQDDSVNSANRIEEYKLELLNNFEVKDRIFIEENNIYYITRLENSNILITGIEFASISIFIYEGIFFMLLIIAVVVIANIYFTRRTSDKIISAFSSINTHLKMINEGKFKEIETNHDYEEVSDVLQEISLVYQNIYDYILQNKKEKDRIKFIIKNMNQGIIIIDENLKIELINDYAKRVFSDDNDKYYVNIYELASDEVIIKIKECFEKQKNTFFELKNDSKEKIFTYEMTYQTYKHENETNILPLLVIVITDVTKERNEDKLKQEFIANASHELKTPITSITGFSEILLMNEDKFDDASKKYLKIINKESNRMTNIINDMLYLSNLRQHKGEAIEVEDINIKELVESVLTEFESKISKQNITVINEINTVHIESNYQMLKHIVSNIIENAIKYNKENGTITLSCINKKNTVSLIIKDTGIGMDSKNLDKIFDRFYREDESHNRKKKGSGLGLNIVKQISEIINAKISVESEIDKGSKFTITLNKKG